MPICPTCQRQVYHAEQIMGPNRQMYHKPCLVCVNCKTRVDPGGLQEHAGKVYCRNCHRMLFSPRDLRSANVYNPPTPPTHPGPSTPTRQPAYRPNPSSSYSTPTKQPARAPTTTVTTSADRKAEQTGSKGYGTVDDLIAEGSRLDLGDSSARRALRIPQEDDRDDQEEEAEEGAGRLDEGYIPFRVVARSSVRPAQPPPSDSPTEPQQREPDLPANSQSLALSSDSAMMTGGTATGKKVGGPPMVRPKPRELGAGRPLPVPPGSRVEPGVGGTSTSTSTTGGSTVAVDQSSGNMSTEDATIPTVSKPTTAEPTTPLTLRPESSPSTPLRPSNLISTPSRPTWTPSKPATRTPGGGTPSTNMPDTCPACEKRVYLMEAVTALSMKWHKGCLKCVECRSTLDPNKLCDREGKVYCRKCYQNLFGPIGIR